MVKHSVVFSLLLSSFCLSGMDWNDNCSKNEISIEEARSIIVHLQKIDEDHFSYLLDQLSESYDNINVHEFHKLRTIACSSDEIKDEQISEVKQLTPKLMRKFGFERKIKNQ